MKIKLIVFGLLFVLFFVLGKSVFAQTAPASGGLDQLKQEISKIQGDGKYIAALLYNGFGTNGTDFSFTDPEINTICGGACGKIGVNAANFYSQTSGFYQRAQTDGMKNTLEIARNDVPGVLAGLQNANAHGLTPTIRLGVQMDSGGFSNPQDYVNFLKSIDGQVNFTVYAIAGSNEPETELWATPNCTPGDFQCIGSGLAKYMNAVIAGAGGLQHIKLLSPAFNMTDVASPPVVKAMMASGANFGGVVAIAGNAYNIQGVGITAWVDQFMTKSGLAGKSVFMTEIGTFDKTPPKPFDLSNQVPCDNSSVTNPEFHSLRPYPANPCLKKVQDTTLLCANDLVVKKTLVMGPSSDCTAPDATGSFTCKFTNQTYQSTVSVSLDDSKLPIMGNTEDVPNGTWTSPRTAGNNLTAAQRMNSYVSWYLNGVVNRAEQDFSAFDPNYLVNFSGPINKLLPLGLAAVFRIKSVTDANSTPQKPPDDTSARHNQIVGCVSNVTGTGILNFGGFLFLSPCYLPSNGVNPIQNFFDASMKRLTDFIGHTPPLEKNYPNNFAGFWKDYLTWLGDTCLPNLPFTSYYLCVDGTFKAITFGDIFARIFANVPSSTTEDRKGQLGTDMNTVQTTKDPLGNSVTGPQLAHTVQPSNEVFDVAFTPDENTPGGADSSKHSLYFAHMQEDAELATLLQNTYIPSGQSGYSGKDLGPDNPTAFYNDPSVPGAQPGSHCEIQDSRSNSGDSLHGNIDRKDANGIQDQLIKGTLSFSATFTAPCKLNIDKTTGISQPTCNKDLLASMAIFTKTPLAQENWERLVDGTMSIFQRIFPKVGANSPLTEIKNIPAVTTANYSSTSIGSGVDTTLAGAPSSGRPGNQAQVFIPYVGSIQEYFLNGIQKALRPQGFDNAPLAGEPSPTPTPGPQAPAGGLCIEVFPPADKVAQYASALKQSLPGQSGLWDAYFPEKNYPPLIGPQNLFNNVCNGGQACYSYIVDQASIAGINPYLAIAIALNEDGGLRSNQADYSNVKHFGCDPFGSTLYSRPSTIENKLSCMITTLSGNKAASSNDILTSYGYVNGYDNHNLSTIIGLLSNNSYKGVCANGTTF